MTLRRPANVPSAVLLFPAVRACWRVMNALLSPATRLWIRFRLNEIGPLLSFLLFGLSAALFIAVADEVREGETHEVDQTLLLLLRSAANPADPLGPAWLEEAARERLVTYSRRDYPEAYEMLAVLFKRIKSKPRIMEEHDDVSALIAAVESGAGDAANFPDDAYRAAGAEVVPTAAALWAGSDIVFKVRPPTPAEVALMREGGMLVDFVWPAQNPELMQQLAAKKATVLAIDSLPRQLSRAQKMDALTSMAGVSGYRAVIEAANAFARPFNGQVTAAGKIPPAKVFIAGAGVAGLAAIGTAASLGAIVRANDTRAEVADQVVSLGGEFVKVDYEEEGSGGGGYAKVMSEGFQAAQREMYATQAREADIIITTALIPGKPAPKLITADMVKSMKPGSVIVDMAAEQGGNCELTEPGQAVVRHGVTIIGYTDLASRLAGQSSTLYSNNLLRLARSSARPRTGSSTSTSTTTPSAGSR